MLFRVEHIINLILWIKLEGCVGFGLIICFYYVISTSSGIRATLVLLWHQETSWMMEEKNLKGRFL